MKVLVAVGAARHPWSGIPWRGSDDAAAVEMGLRLATSLGGQMSLVHCGRVEEPSLRMYAGMGGGNITVLTDVAAGSEARALADHVLQAKFDCVLMGCRSGFRSGSGLLPYRVAALAGWPLVSRLTDAARAEAGWELKQFMPGGARRVLWTRDRWIGAVGEGGPPPRQVAYARSRELHAEPAAVGRLSEADRAPDAAWVERPARQRAVIAASAAGTAAERRRAMLTPQRKEGERLSGRTPREYAERVLEKLRELGLA